MSIQYTIGVDEAGRGPLAGPVAVAAVMIRKGARIRNGKLGKLKDSKRITREKRERWLSYIKEHAGIEFAVSFVGSRMIDRINITRAANLASYRSVKKLFLRARVSLSTAEILLDGGLYASSLREGIHGKTIIRGDEKLVAIRLASIVAKVYRDRVMKRLGKKHPQYGFEIHKGYGTRAHRDALRKHGPSSAHRKTFILRG